MVGRRDRSRYYTPRYGGAARRRERGDRELRATRYAATRYSATRYGAFVAFAVFTLPYSGMVVVVCGCSVRQR